MRPSLSVDFCGFWDGFEKTENWFTRALRRRFEVLLGDPPDLLFYCDGPTHVWRLHVCTRIYFSVERHAPDWSECDYALTCHDLEDPRNLRLPYYVVGTDPKALVKEDGWAERVAAEDRKFCGLLISNPRAKRGQRRLRFVQKLMERAHVDSGGRWANNVGGPIRGGVPAKRAWLRQYRFNIAFENESLAGYTTEKITDAMLAGCIPVYWGNPDISHEFNPRSFINLADFESDEALIERLLELERDAEARWAILREPWFHENRPNRWFDPERFVDFIERIVSEGRRPVAMRRSWIHPGRWTLVKRNKPRRTEQDRA
jgi:hypothetical protein